MTTPPIENMDAYVDGAMTLYAGGDRTGAAALCRTILSVDPDNVRALYLYGTIRLQDSRPIEAVELFQRGIARAPGFAGLRVNLGVAFRSIGRLSDAVREYQAAIEIDPENASVHMNLGNCFKDLGRFAEAEAAYRRGIAIAPNNAVAHNNLGLVLKEQDRIDEAVAAFRQAVSLDPRLAVAFNNLGCGLVKLDQSPDRDHESKSEEVSPRIEEARNALAMAVRLDPSDAHALSNLADAERRAGNFEEGARLAAEAARLDPSLAEAYFTAGLCLNEQGDAQAAVEQYRTALALRPAYAEARYNLARCLRYLQRYDEAIREFKEAIELKPDFAEAHNALGALYQEIVEVEKAIECYNAAIDIAPGFVSAHWNRGLMRLTIGDYDLGLADFEWRYKLTHAAVEYPGIPHWNGEPLTGARLLVRAEQGFGDTLMCARFLPELRARGARITLECQPGLGEFLRGSTVCDEVFEQNTDDPLRAVDRDRFDLQVWLMSIPGILGVRFKRIPAEVPYLGVCDAMAAIWKTRLDAIRTRTGRPILAGIVWAGSRKNANDHLRSMTLSRMEPLSDVDGVTLVSLQQGPPVTQIPGWRAQHPLIVPEPVVRSFVDTAAMILDLDIVITVDTVVAHIAGALGRPVWTLIPFGPDWRWSINRSDTPWYPSMRLFRQPSPGDWASVIEQVRSKLAGREF